MFFYLFKFRAILVIAYFSIFAVCNQVKFGVLPLLRPTCFNGLISRCGCRVLSGRGLCDELITRPEESYRLCSVVVCDLETSRMGAPYIYDISRLKVNDLTPILLTWRKW